MKTPLAHKLRPNNLDEIIGQQHLVGENMIIRKMIETESLFSMILFGSPGTGKTTLAMVIAKVVLPVPGLPNRIIEKSDSVSIIFLIIIFSPTRCC